MVEIILQQASISLLAQQESSMNMQDNKDRVSSRSRLHLSLSLFPIFQKKEVEVVVVISGKGHGSEM